MPDAPLRSRFDIFLRVPGKFSERKNRGCGIEYVE